LKVVFSDHADKKIAILGSHAARITRRAIEEAVLNPGRTLVGLKGRLIAEVTLDDAHVRRVIFIREESR